MVLTLTMLSVALVQSVGRLGVAVLDELELAMNQWLSAQQVRVTGLSGSWRLTNPVINLEQVDFPAGQVTDVTVEFDWLESLIRNRLVARRLSIGRGIVEFEPDGSGGWRLRGVAGASDLDLDGLLYHSDQLQVATSLVLRDATGATAAAYSVAYVAINRGGRHRHRLLVSNTEVPASRQALPAPATGCVERCGGRFELQAREGLWPLWQEDMQLRGEVDGLDIPTTLSGVGEFAVAQLAFAWQRSGSVSGGQFSMHLQDIVLPDEIGLSVRLAGRVSGSENSHQGVIDEFRWTHERLDESGVSGSWELPELRVRVEESFAEVWAGSMDLVLAAEFLEGAMAGIDLPSRWLRELNVDATALNVRGRLDWPSGEISFAATLADLELDGYKGAPYMRGGAGELIGYRHGVQFSLNSQNMLLQFPATFRDKWQLAYAQGVVQMWFKDGYIGLRGPKMRMRTPAHRVIGGFAITRPSERREERLTLLVDLLDDLDVAQARAYVPYTLSEDLAEWLRTGPQDGVFSQPRFGYHGHVRMPREKLDRRVELTSELQDAKIHYHEDWPEIAGLYGKLVIAGSMVRVEVSEALSAGARLLPGSRVVLRNNAAYADIDLLAELATDDALNFIRDTPLRDSMTFVEPQWTGGGLLALTGDLHIPLQDDDAQDELAVDLGVGLRQADLTMPELRLAFGDLQGQLRYRYPNSLEGSGITGTTFGSPAAISARNDAQSMVLRVEGSATHEDVHYVLEMEDPGVVAGAHGIHGRSVYGGG